MKLLKTIAATIVAIASIASAQAQNVYAGIGYSQLNIDSTLGAVKPTLTVFSVGYSVNENLAIEGRLGTSASAGSLTYLGVPVSVKADSYSAIYLKGIFPANDQFTVYGIFGYNNATATVSAQGFSATSETKSSSSYGVGAEFNVTKNIALTGEWARHYSDTTSTTFAVKYKF